MLLERFLNFLRNEFGLLIDIESLRAWLYETFSPITGNINDYINSISGSDLIVSLDSAKVEGIPTRVIPYIHGYLHRPENQDDIRYKLVKDFILKGADAVQEEPVIMKTQSIFTTEVLRTQRDDYLSLQLCL